MTQLKKFAENPEGPTGSQKAFGREFLESPSDTARSTELDGMMTDNPIPGQSLTQDPGAPLPNEGPPRFTQQREFIDHLFNQLSDEDILPEILQSMRLRVPVEEVAHKVLRGQLMKGNINPDMLLLSIEPTIYMLIGFATYAEIDPVLYPEGDFDEDEANDTMAAKFREGADRLTEGADVSDGLTVEDIQAPAVVPSGLMTKTKAAVASLDAAGTGETE
jgi:hypothetical protein